MIIIYNLLKSHILGYYLEYKIMVSKINYSNDITSSFNEWIDSSMVVIDEVPQSAKDVEKLQNDVKTMSGAKTIKITANATAPTVHTPTIS